MSIQFNAAELRRISLALKEVSDKIAKKHLRTAGRKAMTIVRDQVKANAPVDTGKVKTNVAMQVTLRRNTLTVRVGVRGGAKKNLTTPYYWRMVEFGTRHMPARPFLVPALEQNTQAVLDEFTKTLGEQL